MSQETKQGIVSPYRIEETNKGVTYEEAYPHALEYFHNAELPASVFLDKYALKTKEGRYIEVTPMGMHRRLAHEFARIDANKYGLNFEERRQVYIHALANLERIVPQGSPMAAIGNQYQLMSASNCVVVASPDDSMEGIFQAGEELAQLMKRRCGVGLDCSTLRPEGMRVNNAAKTTSGAWTFCDFYSYVTRMVCQSGRRGALMLTMDVHHPDIARFITMKMDKTKVTGANVSVRYSDEFMLAVVNDTEYEQRWPLENPVIRKKVRARDIWDLAIKCATDSAEPGCIFWDTITNYLPAHSYERFKTISTNPCSEIALSPYDSCRLISMNLTGYVVDPFLPTARFDWDLFKQDIATATQMSDNLVDLELECIRRIMGVCSSDREMALWQKLYDAGADGRRIGLGTHALGDMLSQLRIKYDSDEALKFVDGLYSFFSRNVYTASIDLAEVRGPFLAWDWDVEKDNDYIKRLPADIQERAKQHGRRNIACMTQAPTGTVSLCSKTGRTFPRFSTSSGVEPLYAVSQIRRRKNNPSDDGARVDHIDELGDTWQEYNVFHPNVQNYLDHFGALDGGNLPDFFVQAEDIDWEFRVRLQGIEQKYIDHSISSTINLPRGTAYDVVGGIYLEAWKNGLKGVTVYVDGSRDQVLRKVEDVESLMATDRPAGVVRMQAPKRPKELVCDIHHTSVKGEKYVALVGLLDGEPYELFGGFPGAYSIPRKYKTGRLIKKAKGKYRLHIGKNGDSIIVDDIAKELATPEMEWITRLVSTALRHGTPIDFLCEQLGKTGNIFDFNKVISRVLKKYIKDGQTVRSSLRCSECSSTNVIYQDGCPMCQDCGNYKCG